MINISRCDSSSFKNCILEWVWFWKAYKVRLLLYKTRGCLKSNFIVSSSLSRTQKTV